MSLLPVHPSDSMAVTKASTRELHSESLDEMYRSPTEVRPLKPSMLVRASLCVMSRFPPTEVRLDRPFPVGSQTSKLYIM